ncbi:hypothetical protein KUCAC02_029647, partial [Chaenocephalus aceratus]
LRSYDQKGVLCLVFAPCYPRRSVSIDNDSCCVSTVITAWTYRGNVHADLEAEALVIFRFSPHSQDYVAPPRNRAPAGSRGTAALRFESGVRDPSFAKRVHTMLVEPGAARNSPQ